MVAQDHDSVVKQRLGEILVNRNVITQEQLDQALKEQEKLNIYIGEILINLGYIEERDVVVALVVQCNLPYIAIDKYEVDQSIIQLVPEELARKHKLVALDRVGDVLSVVMADPLDTAVTAEIKRMTNCKIAPFIATQTEIAKALDRFYHKES